MRSLGRLYKKIYIRLTERGHPNYYYELRAFGFSQEQIEERDRYWGERGVKIAREVREKMKGMSLEEIMAIASNKK